MSERPEVPLSDEIIHCAFDATVHEDTHEKPADRDAAWLSLGRSFIGFLGEATFYNWIGMRRPRPRLDKVRDAGDVPLGGSIKAAPFWKDTSATTGAAGFRAKGRRTDQFWNFTEPRSGKDRWAVFIGIEDGRDLGPANQRQLRMAEKCLLTRRWIIDGRWKEMVGTIWGWQTIDTIMELPVVPSVKDGTIRAVKERRLVSWRHLHPWPAHPRPTTPDELFRLLGLEADDNDRQQAFAEMRRSTRLPE